MKLRTVIVLTLLIAGVTMPLTNAKPSSNIGPSTSATYYAETATSPDAPVEPSNSEKATGIASGQTYTSSFANWIRRLTDKWIRFLYEVFSIQHDDTGGHKDVTVTSILRRGGTIQVSAAGFQPYANTSGAPTSDYVYTFDGWRAGFQGVTGLTTPVIVAPLQVEAGEYLSSLSLAFERHESTAVTIGISLRVDGPLGASLYALGGATTADSVNGSGQGFKTITVNQLIPAGARVSLQGTFYCATAGVDLDHFINGVVLTFGNPP